MKTSMISYRFHEAAGDFAIGDSMPFERRNAELTMSVGFARKVLHGRRPAC
jgi:hypothetical protein